MTGRIGWGFLGAGSIANRFMSGLKEVDDGYLAAVGSRTEGKAEAFTAKHGGTPYNTYEAMLGDKRVDVVYIATPHPFHLPHARMALEAGKSVLCEKPMTPNAAQAGTMADLARKRGLFLMEAMWTRFFPVMAHVRQWLSAGEIGPVHLVQADFGFAAVENPASRLFDPALAGGSLLDVGVYTISFASMVFGGRQPDRILAMHEPAATGVDARTGCLFGYEGGGMAQLFSAVRTTTPHEARIIGENGYILIPRFWHPKTATLVRKGKAEEVFDCDYPAEGFQFEIRAVQDDLRAGRTENSLMPLAESVAIAKTLDSVRAQLEIVYPFEKDTLAQPK
jgi:predicted dehydrogenase